VVHQALTTAVESLNVLLFNGLARHELHVWLLDRTADCCGIIAVILLVLGEWLHILGGNDPDLMSRSLELPLPVESACAGFYRDRARRQSS
jgi:hypothetical protein